MSTLPQQIQALRNNITSLKALVNGTRDTGILYAILGNFVVFGCKVVADTNMTLLLDGQASGDSANLNPDIENPPLRPEEYENIAMIYGEGFLMGPGTTVTLEDAPGTAGHARYDSVFAYVGQGGPAIDVMPGTSSTAVRNDFIANGLDASGQFDPVLPRGTMQLARVYVEVGVTSIINARIRDTRNFTSRLG
jgi:hypothetical protein